jgi:hypothetical protein
VKKLMMATLFTLALILALSPRALADPADDRWDHHRDRHHDDNTAPEVDPGLAIGGLTLLGGSLTVLRARRRR